MLFDFVFTANTRRILTLHFNQYFPAASGQARPGA